MKAKKTKRKDSKPANKKRNIVSLLIGIAIIILANYVGSSIFHRFDLTAEKRYSLSEVTTRQLEELEDVIFVRVYLDGDLPANYKRLRNATQEVLDEFRAYAGDNIQYEFIDPSDYPTQKERNKMYQSLSDRGLQYTNLKHKEGDKFSEQIIFPGAIISKGDNEFAIQLLKSQLGASEEAMLNSSIQQLEFELSSGISNLLSPSSKRIAILEGHGELSDFELSDFAQSLSVYHDVKRLEIKGRLDALNNRFDMIIVAGPDSSFSEKDKFIIDQFIMRGGRALWMIEPVQMSIDSIRKNGVDFAIGRDLNLGDQLFKYGARVNPDLVMDMQGRLIPVITSKVGDQVKTELLPWFYSPLIMSYSAHPIVNGMDALKTDYVSSIDTVGDKNIKKTVLLTTSKYSKIASLPHRISLGLLKHAPDIRQYKKSNIPVAVLLEGNFKSNFANRLTKQITGNKEINFKEKAVLPSKQIVIGDANIAKNDRIKTGEYYKLGWDKYTKRLYGNKEFLVNCVHYLLDDNGLIDARGKEFKLRLLDKQRIAKERSKWQFLNLILPVVLVVLIGLLHAFLRKRKFAR